VSKSMPFVELGIPGVLDAEIGVGAVVRVVKDACALGLRAYIQGFGEGVVEVERQAMRGGMAEGELQRVVRAGADRIQRIKGRKLIAPEG